MKVVIRIYSCVLAALLYLLLLEVGDSKWVSHNLVYLKAHLFRFSMFI